MLSIIFKIPATDVIVQEINCRVSLINGKRFCADGIGATGRSLHMIVPCETSDAVAVFSNEVKALAKSSTNDSTVPKTIKASFQLFNVILSFLSVVVQFNIIALSI